MLTNDKWKIAFAILVTDIVYVGIFVSRDLLSFLIALGIIVCYA